MTRFALLACPLLLCLACSREEPATSPAAANVPAEAPAAVPPAPATTNAPAAAPAPADPSSTFDTGAFAGTFSGEGMRLELHADGTYGMEGPDGITQGSWTHEAASSSIRLDPGSKTAQDRVFRMTGRDTLVTDGATLRRQPAP